MFISKYFLKILFKASPSIGCPISILRQLHSWRILPDKSEIYEKENCKAKTKTKAQEYYHCEVQRVEKHVDNLQSI